MVLKIFTGLKKRAIKTVALSGVWVIANWTLPASASDQPLPDQNPSKERSVMIAQSETRTTAPEKTAPSSESSASESKTREKEESAEAREKPLEEFRPSERIEAEQAVDFPYDI
jgi:hypothetical protein